MTRALIVDIDDTLCTHFDRAIPEACAILRALDRRFEIHYVTSRPEASRRETERFLDRERLPGWKNLHCCPDGTSSKRHKLDCNRKILRWCEVLASIGDADEDEWAAREAGIPFVRVDRNDPAAAWRELATRLRE